MAGTERSTCEMRAAAPMPAHNHGTDPLGSRAGTACLNQGCHGGGGGSTVFAFAGTVYKQTSSTEPATGVTVRIFKGDATTSLAKAVTDDAGNFVIRTPTNFADFPYETDVSGCGPPTPNDIRPMINQIAAGDANCSLGGTCHGGSQGKVFITDS